MLVGFQLEEKGGENKAVLDQLLAERTCSALWCLHLVIPDGSELCSGEASKQQTPSLSIYKH